MADFECSVPLKSGLPIIQLKDQVRDHEQKCKFRAQIASFQLFLLMIITIYEMTL